MRPAGVKTGTRCQGQFHVVIASPLAAAHLPLARADSASQATLWIRRRGSGVDNTAGVKRQEAPETLTITHVSQQCAALSHLKETDANAKVKIRSLFDLAVNWMMDSRPSARHSQQRMRLHTAERRSAVCFANPAPSDTCEALNPSRV